MTVFVLFLVAMVVGIAPSVSATTFQKVAITQENFKTTRFITKPGYYLFAESVVFPCYEPALVIDADDVTVDFGGYVLAAPQTITQSGSRDHVGIRIEKRRNNISIINGTVSYFHDNGIDMNDNSNISVLNMKLISNGSGCVARNVATLICKDSSIFNSHVDGIRASSISGSTFSSIFISDAGQNSPVMDKYCGFNLESVYNCEFTTCVVTGLQAQNTVTGFSIVASSCNSFSACKSSGNSATLATGFYLAGGSNNKFSAIEASRNSGSLYTESEVCGFFCDEGETAFLVTGSDFSNNSSFVGSAYGMKIGRDGSLIFPSLGIIQGNSFMQNSGAIVQYGVKDFSIPSANAYITNKAFGQGRTFTAGSTMIDTGSMNYCIFTSELNNIVKETSYTDQTLSANDISLKNISYYQAN